MRFSLKLFVILLTLTLLVIACRNDEAASPAAVAPGDGAVTSDADAVDPVASPAVVPSATVPLATATPSEPLAASVNGEPIFLSRLEAEVAQRNNGLFGVPGADLSETEARQVILEMLIDQVLISQAAAARGITVEPAAIAAEMAELRRLADEAAAPETGGYAAWLAANGWDEADLERAVAQQLLTERLIAEITADVPSAVPQARARYLQVDGLGFAQALRDQARAGADFAELARTYSLDRATGEQGGDLGYFAVGTLLVPEVEAVAFNLQPGEVSDVLTVTNSDSGQTTYYLVQLIEIDPARPLTAERRAILLQARFEEWLAEQRANADIVLHQNDGT